MGKLSEDEFNYFYYESLAKSKIFEIGKKLIQDRPETKNPLSEKMTLLEEKKGNI